MDFLRFALFAVAATSSVLAFPGDHFPGAPGYHADGPNAYPKYNYGYDVHSPHTGDVKNQWEERNGDVVKGSYSLQDADGTIRTVEYTADDHNGFNAVVKKDGKAAHPPAAAHPGAYGPGHHGGPGLYGSGHPGGAVSHASVNLGGGYHGGPHHGAGHHGGAGLGFGSFGAGPHGGATSYANGNVHSYPQYAGHGAYGGPSGAYGGPAGAYGGPAGAYGRPAGAYGGLAGAYGPHAGGPFDGHNGGFGATSHANSNNLAFGSQPYGGWSHGGHGAHGGGYW